MFVAPSCTLLTLPPPVPASTARDESNTSDRSTTSRCRQPARNLSCEFQDNPFRPVPRRILHGISNSTSPHGKYAFYAFFPGGLLHLSPASCTRYLSMNNLATRHCPMLGACRISLTPSFSMEKRLRLLSTCMPLFGGYAVVSAAGISGWTHCVSTRRTTRRSRTRST